MYLPALKPGGRGTDLPVFLGTVPHHLGVNRTTHTVVQLHIDLGQCIHYKKQKPPYKNSGLGRNRANDVQ